MSLKETKKRILGSIKNLKNKIYSLIKILVEESGPQIDIEILNDLHNHLSEIENYCKIEFKKFFKSKKSNPAELLKIVAILKNINNSPLYLPREHNESLEIKAMLNELENITENFKRKILKLEIEVEQMHEMFKRFRKIDTISVSNKQVTISVNFDNSFSLSRAIFKCLENEEDLSNKLNDLGKLLNLADTTLEATKQAVIKLEDLIIMLPIPDNKIKINVALTTTGNDYGLGWLVGKVKHYTKRGRRIELKVSDIDKIYIAINAGVLKGAGVSGLRDTLVHELVHGFDPILRKDISPINVSLDNLRGEGVAILMEFIQEDASFLVNYNFEEIPRLIEDPSRYVKEFGFIRVNQKVYSSGFVIWLTILIHHLKLKYKKDEKIIKSCDIFIEDLKNKKKDFAYDLKGIYDKLREDQECRQYALRIVNRHLRLSLKSFYKRYLKIANSYGIAILPNSILENMPSTKNKKKISRAKAT